MKAARYENWALPVLSAWPKVLEVVAGGTPAPEVVEIFPTGFCNFHCPHCRFREDHVEGAFMDLDTLKRLLDEIGQHQVRNIELSGGGEPLVHPQINEVLDYFIEGGFRVGLITNGYRFIGENGLAERALRCCNWIRFSVDAFTDETYQRVHDSANLRYGDLRRAILGLRRAAKETPKIGIKILISKLNASDALLMIPEALSLSMDFVQFKFLGSPESLVMADEDAERLKQRIEGQIESIGDALTAEILPPYRGPVASDKCLMTYLHPVIDWDGEVYICAFFEHRRRQHSLGNIRTAGFFPVWEAPRHREAFDAIDPATCVPNCPMRRYNPLVNFIVRETYRRGFF